MWKWMTHITVVINHVERLWFARWFCATDESQWTLTSLINEWSVEARSRLGSCEVESCEDLRLRAKLLMFFVWSSGRGRQDATNRYELRQNTDNWQLYCNILKKHCLPRFAKGNFEGEWRGCSFWDFEWVRPVFFGRGQCTDEATWHGTYGATFVWKGDQMAGKLSKTVVCNVMHCAVSEGVVPRGGEHTCRLHVQMVTLKHLDDLQRCRHATDPKSAAQQCFVSNKRWRHVPKPTHEASWRPEAYIWRTLKKPDFVGRCFFKEHMSRGCVAPDGFFFGGGAKMAGADITTDQDGCAWWLRRFDRWWTSLCTVSLRASRGLKRHRKYWQKAEDFGAHRMNINADEHVIHVLYTYIYISTGSNWTTCQANCSQLTHPLFNDERSGLLDGYGDIDAEQRS